jgi:hypothetical protein
MDELFRRKILALLDQHRTMRIATLRPDGWPQVTTRTAKKRRTWRATTACQCHRWRSRAGDGHHWAIHGGAGKTSWPTLPKPKKP